MNYFFLNYIFLTQLRVDDGKSDAIKIKIKINTCTWNGEKSKKIDLEKI